MEKDIAAGDEFDITLKKFGSAYKATVVDSDGSIYTNAVETSNTFGDTIYPGFFAARNVCVTFSDIDLFVDTRTITNLEITTPPSKTEYYIGEDFDPERMVVTAVYDDGSKEVFEDYAAVCDTSALGDSTVTVTVGSVSASYPVTVRKMYVTNISLDSEPLINRYYEYQLFTDSGIEGTFTFENGKTEEISETNAEYTVDGSVIDASKYWLSDDAGGKTVYISYADTDTVEGNGVSVSYNITVYPYSLTEIYIASEPYKVDYSIGDEFSSEGLQVLGMYSDGTNVYSDILSEDTYSILGFSTLTGGTKTATVRLNADTSMKATFTYTVRTPYVTDCSITHYPRTTYAMGTDISEIESEISENMVITVTYSSGLTQTLSSDEYEIDTSEVNTSVDGCYTINITPYNSEFTACSFDITIWDDDKTFYWRACKFGATSSNSSYSLTNTDETGLAEEVQLTSWNGAGKVTNSGHDGIVYYYTRINSDNNFTISGDVYVNMFLQGETNLTRYGQEAFGIMARDVIPLTPDSYYSTDSETYEGCGTSIVVQTENAKLDEYGEPVPSNTGSDFFSNVVLAGGFPTSSYKTGDNATAANANNNRMKLWIRTGMKLWNGTSGAVTNREYLLYDGSEFDDYLITAEEFETGECFYPQKGDQYNIVLSRINGGYYVETTLLAVGEGNEEYSDLIGTTWSYAWDYSLDGGLESDPLLDQNEDTIYAGFFAARWADISVTNIAVYESCTDTDYTAAGENTKKEDPSLSLKSSLYTYDTEYTLILAADNSYGGNVIIKLGDEVIANGTSVGTDNTAFSLSLEPNTANELVIAYTPSSYAYLTSYSTITYRYTLYCLGAASSGTTIYAAPEEGSGESESGVYGTFYNSGTKTSPLNLDTAVAIVEEGQTIVLLNGTYYRDSAIEITDANCGASGGYKTLKAETDGGVTIDMQRNDAGIIIGGDYWHIKGIKFLNSAVGESGGYLSGSHCIIDSCVFAESGSTGFQIAGSSSDSFSLWPSNNLIVYCESYNSVSNTAGASDGFGCKLAVGNGNIFKNCVAHNNDDDGWDLYTKTSTGAIGAVLLEDCISYNCSYYLITEDNLGGANAGTARNKAVFGSSLDPANYAVGEQVLVQSASASGNGFKLGGENTYVQHYIKDSVAFGNKAKGFDSNSNPAMKIRNCIAYNNGTGRLAVNNWGYDWTVSSTPYIAPNYGLYSGVTDLTFNYNLDGVISACAYTSDQIATYSSYLSGTNQADSSSTLTSLYNTAQSTNTERYPVLTLNKNLKAAHIESRTNYLVKSTDDLSTAEWGTTRDGHTLTGYVSVNSEGDEITPDWFVSLNESDAIGDDGFIINHSAGGAYDLGDFLKPNSDYIYLYSTSDIPDYSDTYILFFGTEYQQGDVDKNGDVDLIDSISILKYINDEMLFSKSQLKLADVNGDGEIDKKDAALALKKAILNA
ncbi:MAG: bacterial Ig-like domain-containing protein [Eubacterium sp.]|nr:bacterial Ig-like domain-containing protein [Eubacterium sp.]